MSPIDRLASKTEALDVLGVTSTATKTKFWQQSQGKLKQVWFQIMGQDLISFQYLSGSSLYQQEQQPNATEAAGEPAPPVPPKSCSSPASRSSRRSHNRPTSMEDSMSSEL